MASSGIRRKVDDLGRVVIPAGIRRTLGIREGDPVEVTVEGERVVLAKPHEACVFCGREEDRLTPFRGRLVCRDCLGSLGAVDERLRASEPAPAPAVPEPRRAADLPDWDAPPRSAAASHGDIRPREGPAASGPAADDAAPPPPASVREPSADDERGDAPGGPGDEHDPDEADEAVARARRGARRPPYEPSSTTAW